MYVLFVTATGQVTVILDESICCVQINREFIGHIGELPLSTGYGISYWHRWSKLCAAGQEPVFGGCWPLAGAMFKWMDEKK